MNIKSLKTYLNNPGLLVIRVGKNSFLKYMNDEKYLKMSYKIHTGNELDLEHPQTFNEKIQWLKIHDRKKIYTLLADKCEAKNIVSNILGEEYIIPTLGVWEKFEDITWDSLPEQFVLKCTHDSGGLVICREKRKLDIETTKKIIMNSARRNYYWSGREWPYKNIKPRIIAEKYMIQGNESGLRDYKFFCFSGVPKMLYVSEGLENHETAKISFYDLQGNELPFHRKDYKPLGRNIELPNNFNEMIKVAEKLAKYVDNPFVRIDLYSIRNRIYFSEVTFSPCGGNIPFDPEEWDRKLGDWIDLN